MTATATAPTRIPPPVTSPSSVWSSSMRRGSSSLLDAMSRRVSNDHNYGADISERSDRAEGQEEGSQAVKINGNGNASLSRAG
jgi:hypothetical protein